MASISERLPSISNCASNRKFICLILFGCVSTMVVVVVLDSCCSRNRIIRGIASWLMSDSDDNDRRMAVIREIHRVKKRVENPAMQMTLAEYAENAKRNKTKLILVYTEFFHAKPWGWMRDTEALNHWEGTTCSYFHCRLTYNHRELQHADAVLFHSKDMPGNWVMKNLLKHKPQAQKWIYFAKETPMNTESPARLNNMFHWTLAYRQDSTFHFPYGFYYKANQITKKPAISYVRSKDKLAVWVASHCGLPREKVVQSLIKYMKVDVIGKCAAYINVKPVPCTQDAPKCKQYLRRYKFLFAFENSNCRDYITEKYWMALKEGIVPVVLGGASYSSDIALPGSFINALDFPSAKALAERLLYLDRNDEEYSKYLEWRNSYKIVDYPPWNCEVCAALNMNSKQTHIARLDKFWSAKEHCGNKDAKVRRLIERG